MIIVAANRKNAGDNVRNALECHLLQYYNFRSFVDELKDLSFVMKMCNASATQQIKQATILDTVCEVMNSNTTINLLHLSIYSALTMFSAYICNCRAQFQRFTEIKTISAGV